MYLAVLQSFKLKHIRTENFQFKLFDTAVILEYGRGNWKWYKYQAQWLVVVVPSCKVWHLSYLLWLKKLESWNPDTQPASWPAGLYRVVVTQTYIFHESKKFYSTQRQTTEVQKKTNNLPESLSSWRSISLFLFSSSFFKFPSIWARSSWRMKATKS